MAWRSRTAYALSLNPQSPASHYYLGNALSNLGRTEEALVHWKQVVALKPDGREGRRAREKLVKKWRRSWKFCADRGRQPGLARLVGRMVRRGELAKAAKPRVKHGATKELGEA